MVKGSLIRTRTRTRIVRDREKGVLYMDQSAAITRLAQKCGLDKDPPKRRYDTPMHVDLPSAPAKSEST